MLSSSSLLPVITWVIFHVALLCLLPRPVSVRTLSFWISSRSCSYGQSAKCSGRRSLTSSSSALLRRLLIWLSAAPPGPSWDLLGCLDASRCCLGMRRDNCSNEKNGTASKPHLTVRAGPGSSASHSQRGTATEMGNLKTLSWFNRFLGCIFWWRAFIDSTMLVLLNKASTQMRKTWSLSCNELWVIFFFFFGVPLLASYRSSVHLVWYLA